LHRHFDREDLLDPADAALPRRGFSQSHHTLTVDRVTPINQVDALELYPHAPSFMAQSDC
jgi:hypothetical protein